MKRSLALALLVLAAACEKSADTAAPPAAPADGAAPAAAAPAADAGDATPTAAPAAEGAAAAGDAAPAPAGAPAAAPADGAPAAAAPVAKPARRFLEVVGTVTIDGKPAAVDTEIGKTAVLVTAADSNAVFTIGEGSLIEMRANSRVEVGASERKTDSLKLALGTLWSILPTGSSYEVATDNAVAGVRGTIFFMEKDEKETYICACDGTVEVTAAKAKKPNVLVSKHEHKGVAVGKIQKKAKLKNHTDEQVTRLLALMPKAP